MRAFFSLQHSAVSQRVCRFQRGLSVREHSLCALGGAERRWAARGENSGNGWSTLDETSVTNFTDVNKRIILRFPIVHNPVAHVQLDSSFIATWNWTEVWCLLSPSGLQSQSAIYTRQSIEEKMWPFLDVFQMESWIFLVTLVVLIRLVEC